MAAFLRYCSALSSGGESTTRPPAASLLLAAGPGRLRSFSPPSVAAFPRYRSALSSGGESTTRPPAASLLLAASGPPSFVFAAIRGGFSSLSLGTLFGRRVYDSPSSSKPPACCFRAAFVRFRRHPWRLFLAIARHSLREASLRLALQQQASCLLLPGRLRSFSPPSVAAFPRYRSALSSGGESTTRLPPTALPKCSRSLS